MKKNIILFLLFIPFLGQAHQQATCNIYEEGEQLKMKIAMGEHHIIEAVETQFPFLLNNSSQEEIDDCIVEYVHQNLDIDFNKQETTFNYQQISSHRGYLLIEGQFDIQPNKVKSVVIQNSLLVNEVNYHSNLVEFNLNGQFRSFRLHKDRQKTIINNLFKTEN